MLVKEFNAVHVKVVNMTYYYRNRKRLGAKKFHAREARNNPTSNQWDANIWTLEFDPATGKEKVKKTWLGQTSKQNQGKQHMCVGGDVFCWRNVLD